MAEAGPPAFALVRSDGSTASGPRRRVARWLGAALVVGFILRALVGLATYGDRWNGRGGPPRDWWLSGYTEYGDIAISLVEGHGYRRGESLAPRPPAYPLLLAGFYRVGGRSAWPPVLGQAAVGAAAVLVAFLIGHQACAPATGVLAGWMAAVYPYYVAHDTAQQETALFTVLTGATVYVLLRARRSGSLAAHTAAGAVAGVALLCRETLGPFVLLAGVWLARPNPARSAGRRLVLGGVFLGVAAFTVAPWLARNARVVGRPIFGGRPGYQVWVGHNPSTLSHYPWGSIDRSTDEALARMPPEERADLARLSEAARDRWFLRRGVSFALEDPARLARYAAVKMLAAFGPFKSPLADGIAANLTYSVSYVTVVFLGLVGVRAGPSRDLVSLTGLLVASFVAVTLPTHAHASHRSHLDLLLMVFAAAGAMHLAAKRLGRHRPRTTSGARSTGHFRGQR